MDAQENTREGGTERTAAAGSASRDFCLGDAVILTIGGEHVRGTIVDTYGRLYVVSTGNLRAYRLPEQLAPIEDAPADVVEAAQDTPGGSHAG